MKEIVILGENIIQSTYICDWKYDSVEKGLSKGPIFVKYVE